MPWRLRVDDALVLREDDLTVGECERIEAQTGDSWHVIHPLRSAKHARVILQVAFERTGASAEDAEAKAKALTMQQVLDAYERVEDDRPTEFVDGLPPSGDGTPTAG